MRQHAHTVGRPLLLAIVSALLAVTLAAPAAQATPGLVTTDLNGGVTAADLAATLVGPGVSVSNVQYVGASDAAGTFSGGGTGAGAIIGFDQGVILSSGSIAKVVGPNQFGNVTADNGQPGDADLEGLLSGQTTYDAAALSFDFVPDATSISFRYVFASDEYNEYANSSYNDVFGFFVNGSGPSADCATIDGQPVSVNTINGGNPIGTNAQHPELYRNNSTDPGPATIDTEMDGLTTTLLCQASVTPNQTNTLKLAIADTSDALYDSNVFIEAGSLTTIPPVDTPTDVTAYPGNGSAIVTWSFPGTADSFDVVCTATSNPDDVVSVNVPGTQTNAQVGGLSNGIEYACAVRARSGEAIGPFSDPSAPFTPSDAAVAQFVDPRTGGTVSLAPVESFVGTSGQITIPRQKTSTTASLTIATPVIVSASLFGVPGEVDVTCGGNTCVGQGIEWAVSDPSAIGKMNVVFFESPALVNHLRPRFAKVYKDGVLLPLCKNAPGATTCVKDRDSTPGGGWKITIRATGEDPRGRI